MGVKGGHGGDGGGGGEEGCAENTRRGGGEGDFYCVVDVCRGEGGVFSGRGSGGERMGRMGENSTYQKSPSNPPAPRTPLP